MVVCVSLSIGSIAQANSIYDIILLIILLSMFMLPLWRLISEHREKSRRIQMYLDAAISVSRVDSQFFPAWCITDADDHSESQVDDDDDAYGTNSDASSTLNGPTSEMQSIALTSVETNSPTPV